MQVRRLRWEDESIARALFAMMAVVFEADDRHEPLDDDYLRRLLQRSDFFVVAAIDDDAVIGGITGHVLPMTRSPSSELFIYDLAVRADRQRQGVGRALVTALNALAAAEGITTSFVPADNEDTHALAFYQAIGGEASPVTFFTFTATDGSSTDARRP
jgi:aminoglycoside 3-N-acetyltransferase I